MKNVLSKLLALMLAAGVCHADSLQAGENQILKAQRQLISKSLPTEIPLLPLLDTSVMITYTPVSQPAGGTWQMMLLAPDGKLYRDRKHKRIDILNPPTTPLHFKVKGPLPAGVYAIIVYVKARSDSALVNLQTIATDISVFPGDRKGFLVQPAGFLAGSSTSTRSGDSAQVFFSLFDPKHQAYH